MNVRRATLVLILMCMGAHVAAASNIGAQRELIHAQVQEAADRAPSPSSFDGFEISTANGDFTLGVQGQVQFRYIANLRDTPATSDEYTGGFQMRRLKLIFSGQAYEDFEYKVTLSADRGTGEIKVSDAFVNTAIGEGATLKWGQFKLPLLREQLASSKRLLAVERSMVDAVFSQGRAQAVELTIDSDRLLTKLAFSDGLKSNNTDFGDDDTDWALTGRLEWTVSGSRRVLHSLTGSPDQKFGAVLGVAAHTQESAHLPGDGPESLTQWTADLTIGGPGWSTLFAGVGRYTEEDGYTDWGFLAEIGFFVTDQFAPFLRYDIVIPDHDRDGDDVFNEITAGFNYFVHGHAAKFTFDANFYPDSGENNDLISNQTGIGYLVGEADEFLLRAQFQLLF